MTTGPPPSTSSGRSPFPPSRSRARVVAQSRMSLGSEASDVSSQQQQQQQLLAQNSPYFHHGVLLRYSPNNSSSVMSTTMTTSQQQQQQQNSDQQPSSGVRQWSPHRMNSLGSRGSHGHGNRRFFESSSNNAASSKPTTTHHPVGKRSNRTSRSENENDQNNDSSHNATATTGGCEDNDDDDDDETVENENATTTSTTATTMPATTTAAAAGKNLVQDGIPIHHLRNLACQAVLDTPSQAAFYASLLYSKTRSDQDALMLAQAYLLSHNYAACLRILEESTLFQDKFPWEALLLACAALAQRGEWTALADMLQDACRIPNDNNDNNNPNQNDPLLPSFRSITQSAQGIIEDDDDQSWESLKHYISKKFHAGSEVPELDGNVHHLASICWWRGQAYMEMGHGLRAAVYWKRALRIDCQCQQAWESLLQRNLLSPAESHELLTQHVTFPRGMEWLRSIYLARIELTPQERFTDDTVGAASAGGVGRKPQPHSDFTGAVQPATTSTPSFAYHGGSIMDASSIEMLSPLHTFQTPASVFVGGNGGANMSSLSVVAEKKANENDENKKKDPNAVIQADVDAAFDKLWNEHKLQKCPQVLAMAARRAYRRYDWKEALAYCQDLIPLDPTLADAAFCYIATLAALGHNRVLFRIAHEWVDAAPKSAQSWFAVGAYYYACERYHIAQRHFCRATRLDPTCTEAWIAFGCSFAACDESDQALASFRAAQRLSPGEHTSLLYMGMEYVRTNHLVLAQYFLQSAWSASGGDPLCAHELGVLAAQKGDSVAAMHWFQQALASAVRGKYSDGDTVVSVEECIELCQDPYWEPTLFNLGHAYRKSRRFPLAAACFQQCVALCPEQHSCLAALAFTKHLQGDLDAAIEHYHAALSKKPDDPFSTEMLARALQDALSSTLRMGGGSSSLLPDAATATTAAAVATIPTSDYKKTAHSKNFPSFFASPPSASSLAATTTAASSAIMHRGPVSRSLQHDESMISEEMESSDIDMV